MDKISEEFAFKLKSDNESIDFDPKIIKFSPSQNVYRKFRLIVYPEALLNDDFKSVEISFQQLTSNNYNPIFEKLIITLISP